MNKLLYIESSPRKNRSHSIEIAQDFIALYRLAHQNDEIETWDLWSSPLPDFSGDAIDAKYRILHGQEHTKDEAAAWNRIVSIFNRFNSADKYLFSIPMWNFSIPYKLKHFIDLIVQPGLSFQFSPEEGYKGLVTEKPAVVIYSSGSEFTSEQAKPFDFQKPYFETFLRFIGFSDIKTIVVDQTLSDSKTVTKVKAAAKKTIVSMVKTF